jgi:predicted nucleic acid-binding protein
MRLIDTSVWVEWLIDSSLGKAVADELPAREQWLVPTIVQLELAKWLTRNVGEDKSDQVIAFTETCSVVDLDTTIALSAADLCARHKLATADAIVYATARIHGADLLTCDRHFEGLPGVRFIPKSNG